VTETRKRMGSRARGIGVDLKETTKGGKGGGKGEGKEKEERSVD